MNYYFTGETGKNIENYKALAIAIVEQAIVDLEASYKTDRRIEKRGTASRIDLERMRSSLDIEDFFASEWFLELTSLDGRALLEKAKSNLAMYGKAILTDEDIDKIQRGEEIDRNTKKSAIRGRIR